MRAVPHLDTGVLCVNVPSLAATHATQGVVISCAVLEERVGRLPREPQSCRLHVPMFYSPHLFFETHSRPSDLQCSASHARQLCSASSSGRALFHLPKKKNIYGKEGGGKGGRDGKKGGREGKEGGEGGR